MTFPADIFAGQHFAVVGLGRNGLPAARALVAMGAEVTAWDDSASSRGAAHGLRVERPAFDRVGAMVLSPGIPHALPAPHPLAVEARAAGVPILSDAELLFRAVRKAGSRARFVGITGTNGKSTTTALLAHVLETAGVAVAAGGNLGTAALALPLLGDDGIYCLEMSSYMLERLATLRFSIGTMLNLSADHLDRHGDMAGYSRAKLAIFDRQTEADLAVIGLDDAASATMATRHGAARLITISGHQAADVCCIGTMLQDGHGDIVDLADTAALPGAHNGQNAAAAAAAALALGVSRQDIAAGMGSYPGLPHRQEQVGQIGGVRFVNDSKATNADSTSQALACYDRVVWIAGGMAKDGGISTLAGHFPRVAEALLIGRDAPVLAATLAEHGVPHRVVGTIEAAVGAAVEAARDGGADTVLLSPACASWDQFTGFDQRGDRFRDLVLRLRETV